MDLHFLEAKIPLTKTFSRRHDGSIDVMPYPHAADFRSHHESAKDIQQFYELLIKHAHQGHALLKGTPIKVLNMESRAGSTKPDIPTEFMVIDVDNLPGHTPDQVLTKLGLQDVSHIVQLSASQGIVDKPNLSCHIFIPLVRPTNPILIKAWLIRQNLTAFRDHVTLTKSKAALHYPVDITACQNDKLIYIAPPKCLPPEISTIPATPEARFKLEIRSLPGFQFPQTESLDAPNESEKLINTLRAVFGLPAKRSFVLKVDEGQSYMPSPEAAQVTGLKQARGFTYLNINGGDSFGYWHPDSNHEFIFNFKGEPTYKTIEFLPEYYQAKEREKYAPVSDEKTSVKYYVFRDIKTDTYYNGWFDHDSQEYQFEVAGNKQKLIDFLASRGMKAPKTIPDWECSFNPLSLKQVIPEQGFWNRFKPSRYMLGPHPVRSGAPPTIHRLIEHVVGTGATDAFYNWLAYAFQQRRAAGTAWILQGVPGTGKGLMMHHIIKPLFGATNYTARRMEELEDKFNGYLENCLICYVDEVNIGVSKRADMIMANLKNQITEPFITVRNMRQAAYEVPNFLNWIMSSNMTTSVVLDREDRRFNVGVYQQRPIREVFPDTTALVKQVETELVDFASFLAHYKVDLVRVRHPLRNESRQELIDNSKTSLDIVGEALISGNLELLASYISTETDVMMQIRADAYRALIKEIATTGRNKLSRDEIRTIFLYSVGDVPGTPAKFTRFLTHRGIKLKKVRIGDKLTVGIEVEWKLTEELRQEILTGSTPLLKVVKNEQDGTAGIQRSDG